MKIQAMIFLDGIRRITANLDKENIIESISLFSQRLQDEARLQIYQTLEVNGWQPQIEVSVNFRMDLFSTWTYFVVDIPNIPIHSRAMDMSLRNALRDLPKAIWADVQETQRDIVNAVFK